MQSTQIIAAVHGKRVLYIITSGNLGGAQMHVYDLISCLPDDMEVHVVMGERGWLWEKLSAKNVCLYQNSDLVRPISVAKDFKALRYLYELIKRIRPDFVHCHCSKAGILGRLAAKLCKVPAIYTAHGWAFTDGISTTKKMLYRMLEGIAINWTKVVLCVSEYDRQLALVHMPNSQKKIITIRNGVRNIALSQINNCSKTNDVLKALKIIMVARFSQQKDHALLIRAVNELKKENSRIMVSFIGDGPLLSSTMELVKRLKLEDQITFLGGRNDIPELLSQHDVFVLTSNWEGLPLSILEAMRHGLPVLASDVGGVKEVVTEGVTGYLIPRGNLTTLVDRLRQLRDDRSFGRKLGHAGQTVYKQSFTLEVMAEKILNIYHDIALTSVQRPEKSTRIS